MNKFNFKKPLAILVACAAMASFGNIGGVFANPDPTPPSSPAPKIPTNPNTIYPLPSPEVRFNPPFTGTPVDPAALDLLRDIDEYFSQQPPVQAIPETTSNYLEELNVLNYFYVQHDLLESILFDALEANGVSMNYIRSYPALRGLGDIGKWFEKYINSYKMIKHHIDKILAKRFYILDNPEICEEERNRLLAVTAQSALDLWRKTEQEEDFLKEILGLPIDTD